LEQLHQAWRWSGLARFGPTIPTHPSGLPLALCRLDGLSCCRTLFAAERLSPSARERAPLNFGSINPMLGTKPPAILLAGLDVPADIRPELVISTSAGGGIIPAAGDREPGDDGTLPMDHGPLDLLRQVGTLPHQPPPIRVPDVVPVEGGPTDVQATGP